MPDRGYKMLGKWGTCILFLFSVACVLSGPCAAAETKAEEPIFITSDKVEYLDKRKEGEFTGNVKAVQGKLTLTAQMLRVKFGGEGDDIEEIIATGAVKMVQDDVVATGGRAVFHNQEQKMVLTGSDPRVISEESRFSGETITVFTKGNRFVIETKVKGVIIPEKRK